MSPYSGIEPGSAMERKVESCVEQVMGKHKGDKGFTKSNAIAICREQLNAGVELEPVNEDDLTEFSNHTLLADYKPAELMKFKNAHLCSAGRNLNSDWVDKEGLEELATTMSFLALDDEHNEQKIVGFFVRPRVKGDRLYTDGVVYARRFPEITEQIRNGEKKLSVEATAQKAICSVCGGEFSSPEMYCEHLKDKSAMRKLYGLKARGGAAVRRPAWDTSFDTNAFTMIASQVEYQEEDKVLSFWAKLENKLNNYFQAQRSRTHEEEWDDLSDEEKQNYVSRLPERGSANMQGELAAVELLDLAIEAAKEKKWSKDVDLEEGSLTKLGWPNYNKLAQAVRSGKVSYKKLIGKLNFLRNITKDSATKKKAASFMERLKKAFRKDNKSDGGVKMSEVNVDELNLDELGLVQASELETLEAKVAELEASHEGEVTKLRTGFNRVLELGMGADELEVLANLDEDAYELFKEQQENPDEEVDLEAGEEDDDEASPKKDVVIEGNEDNPDMPFSWENDLPVTLNIEEVQ